VSHKIEVMGLSITLTYIKHDRLKLNANVQSTTRLATPIGTRVVNRSKSIQTSQGKPLQSLVLITRCTDGLLVQTLK
jgi:hypothetical protein